MPGPSLRDLLFGADAERSKDNVVGALSAALKPKEREVDIRKLVNYYFAHEKSKDTAVISQSELGFVYEKCKAALKQELLYRRPRKKKLYASRSLKDETVICGSKNTHGNHEGTRGWVGGWLTTYPSDAHVDLELDNPVMVTRMMVHAANVKASPVNMELYAKDEEKDEWILMRQFRLRRRNYEGSHGLYDFNKKEMFYVLGHASNQEEFEKESWEIHPLAGPGETTGGEPDRYMCAKYWRWRVVDSNGAGYVGINDFCLYGCAPALPAPANVAAVGAGEGAKLTWEPMNEKLKVSFFRIVAYPGGIGHHSNGGFYEECEGNQSEFDFAELSSGVMYQFQVIAVDERGEEGMPSKASKPITIHRHTPAVIQRRRQDARKLLEAEKEEDGQGNSFGCIVPSDNVPLNGMEYATLDLPEEVHEFSDMNDVFASVIKGNFPLVDELGNSNKITLYISGSLEDTVVERKYISQYVLPKLDLWCLSNGYDFSGIDLRWGLPSEVADDHQTYSIHMQELERAFKDSSFTLFCFLSGEKYGSTLLPAVISKADRDVIRAELKDTMKWIIDAVYYLDTNGDPPVYRLQKISEVESVTGHTFWDAGSSRGVHSLMKEIMTVMKNGEDISQELKAWEPSLAIAECQFALRAAEKGHRNKFLCAKRTLENLYKAMESERDLPVDRQKARAMGCTDVVERRALHELRTALTASSNVETYDYGFDWKNDGIDIGREDMSMKRLCGAVFLKSKKLIEQEFASRRTLSEEEQEMAHHATFVRSRSRSFFGRESLLRSTMAAIAAHNQKITVLHGISGAGKTSVMCVCAAKAKIYLPAETLVVARLCGTSPRSSSAKGVVRSICLQILKATSDQEENIPEPFDELVQYFHELLDSISKSLPLAIFIDSLDQLSDEDAGRSQPWKWIPKRTAENVFFVVSTLPDSEYGSLQNLQDIHPRCVEVPLLPSVESIAILDCWMSDRRRTLTDIQRSMVENCLKALESGITMLHLRLLCDRVSRWKSCYLPKPLPLTAQGMIECAYEELEDEHGQKLVEGFLSLLGASKDGLSLDNIVDILSADEDALGGRGQPGTVLEKYDPPIRRVPLFLLARLRHDLSEYIVERGANGMKSLGLYHRQFIEVSEKRYLNSPDKRRKAYMQLIEYFSGSSANKFVERGISSQPYWFFIDGDDRVPNKQKLVELPHALLSVEDYVQFTNVIMNFDYVESKFTAGDVYAATLMEDYMVAIAKLASSEKQNQAKSFFRFITTWFHVLQKNPSCLTSLALNYVPGNPVTRMMQHRWNKKLACEEGGWIKWQNVPGTIDPCVFTNVVPRAKCITTVKCSPDARRCLVAGDAFCGVYDFRTYQLQCDFRGHTSWVRGACFSPDGRYVLSVSNDRTGMVWNSWNAETCSVLKGHISWVMDCAWSPKDHVVLTVSEDGTASLWNPYVGRLLGVYERHGCALKSGTFILAGREAVTGDLDGQIRTWTVPTCATTASAKLEGSINSIAWSGSIRSIAVATDNGGLRLLSPELETLRTFDGTLCAAQKSLLTPSAVKSGFAFPVQSCVFSPNGSELLAAGAEKVGLVYSTDNSQPVGRLVGHFNQVLDVDWMKTPDGDVLLTGSEDQTIKQWQRSDVIPGDVFETFAEGSWKPSSSFAIGFTRQGVFQGMDDESHLFNCPDILGGGKHRPFLTHYSDGLRMGDKTCGNLAPDQPVWAMCGYGNTSTTISSEDGKRIRDFSLADVNLDAAHNTLVWDPTGKPRFFASGHGHGAVVWNEAAGDAAYILDIAAWVWDGSWSQKGHFLAVSADDGTHIFDLQKADNGEGKFATAMATPEEEEEEEEGDEGSGSEEETEEKIDALESVFKGKQSMRCVLNSSGSKLAIIAKEGGYYDSAASAGFLYDLTDLSSVEAPMELEGSFQHAGRILFTSDDKFVLVSFSNEAFRSSPSICAFDSEFGIPVAWFVSPLSNDFKRMAVPYHPCSDFVAVDGKGKIYVFTVEET